MHIWVIEAYSNIDKEWQIYIDCLYETREKARKAKPFINFQKFRIRKYVPEEEKK